VADGPDSRLNLNFDDPDILVLCLVLTLTRAVSKEHDDGRSASRIIHSSTMDHGHSVPNVTIYLPPGVELPEGIPLAAVAYLQSHFIDFYGPMVFG
jgi:hypothetical protein